MIGRIKCTPEKVSESVGCKQKSAHGIDRIIHNLVNDSDELNLLADHQASPRSEEPPLIIINFIFKFIYYP